jgi:pyrroline-5-carboxylate reductase
MIHIYLFNKGFCMNESITFIGGGNMASAMISGLLHGGWSDQEITVVERNADQRERLRDAFNIHATEACVGSTEGAQIVVWAVKPQALREVAMQSARSMAGGLHISIAAGIATMDLCQWFGSDRVIRAMPNTAAIVSSGVTGLFAAAGVSASDKALAERIFQGTGACFWVADDERMNAVTAVSGSGPAYAFHFMEGLQKAASALGFDEVRARELALLVVGGAVRQALATSEPLSVLKKRVTSKGGTTAAALEVLDRNDTQGTTVLAVQAAYARASQLALELEELA